VTDSVHLYRVKGRTGREVEGRSRRAVSGNPKNSNWRADCKSPKTAEFS
jgi:hypothetical protein